MNTYKYIFAGGLMGLVSCTGDITPMNGNQEVQQLTVTGKNFIEAYAGSRTEVNLSDAGATFEWSNNDTIGVFPEKGAQAYFCITENTGKTAVFTGGGWALKASSSYGAYYPFISNFDLERTAIPVNYAGQVQHGNFSTGHLCKYDYMSALPVVPENGAVRMTFEHMGCLMHFKTKVGPSVGVKKVVMSTPGNRIPIKGVLNMERSALEMDDGSMTSELTLMCEDVISSDNTGELSMSFMIPPLDLLGTTFYMVLYLEDGSTSRIEVKGDVYEGGKAYNLTSELLNYDRRVGIMHTARKYTIPSFGGAVDGKGRICWGDYTDEVFSDGAQHEYNDGEEEHMVWIGLPNADSMRLECISDIVCIDFTKF